MATIALVAAILLPLLSIAVALYLHRQALRRADEANEIAKRALDIEEARLVAEKRASILPLRYDPAGNRVFYQVVAGQPLQEVEFEFRNYAGVGGMCRRQMVESGEKWIAVPEFDEPGGLDTPGPKEFLAAARWRRHETELWHTSGLYRAEKGKLYFKPLTDVRKAK